jgi:hypothetical protein
MLSIEKKLMNDVKMRERGVGFGVLERARTLGLAM